MSAQPIHPRADAAARTVDPMLLAGALDHIAKTAARSRTQTRRLRWIEQRALIALDGREYRDIDVDLPRDVGPESIERLKFEVKRLKATNEALLQALQGICDEQDARQGYASAEAYDKARAAIGRATGAQP